ncbi:MAG: RNA polymerase-binding protein DksA [Gammaproteobacteria bacterium]
MPAARATRPSLGLVGFTPYKPKKGEEYMNDRQLAHFSHILELSMEQLKNEADETLQRVQGEVKYPDPLDQASQEGDMNLTLREEDRRRKLRKKIGEALQRIKDNDYGYCVNCGAEIGIQRLEARPTAELCIDCKTFEEIREKQTIGN